MPIVIKTTGFDQYLDPSGGSYIKALIMGDHGVGKTPSAACWPSPIIADCENGLASVASKQVPYASINTSADMEALVQHLRMDSRKPAESRQYRTLVIDTIDSYQRRIIQERLRAEQKESLSGWADWGWLDGKMVQLIENILSLPMHVVVNLHVKDTMDGDGESQTLVKKARLKGDIKDSIFQDFDLIGQMEAGYVPGTGDQKGERVRVRNIRWHAEPRFPALRDRFNKLPRFTKVDFTDQDFFRIFDAITEGVDDLPETAEVETLAVEGDDAPAPAPADTKGGPVESPTLPRKGTAKKAAKKAPAKKAAAKKAEPKPEPTPEPAAELVEPPKGEDPWKPGPDAEPEPLPQTREEKADADAQALVEQTLGGQEVDEATGEIKDPKPEPTPEPKPEPKKTAAKSCGDQPESMASRGFDAAPGCGRELNADNAGKAQIAVLKAKTYLCDSCFAEFSQR